MIDFRIDKPRVELGAGASWRRPTACCAPAACRYELLERTDVRTPLGEVLIARLKGAGHDRGRRPERGRGGRAT